MKHIEKGLLVERYLRGDLSAEEEAAFEEVLLASPELLDQLEAAERLQGGLRDLSAVEGATTPVELDDVKIILEPFCFRRWGTAFCVRKKGPFTMWS